MSNPGFKRQFIAARLRLAREMAGLTQGQVARALDLHRPTVSEIEAGRRKVSAEELSTLADLYGVNVPWIIDDDEGRSNAALDRVKVAARELSNLNEEDLDRLLQLIRALRTSKGAGG